MSREVLVIMAAGMGSRYGGLKQIDIVDAYGHILLDYSVYDAIRAGFRRIVFIINRERLDDFRSIIESRILRWGVEVTLVFQEQSSLIGDRVIPEGRKKPWGTAHAIACLGDTVDSPFAVINADDFYGRVAFRRMYDALYTRESVNEDCFMLGYKLKNTLSENGGVSRGICNVEQGCLKSICEVAGIRQQREKIISSSGAELDSEAMVSMNFWGLTPEIIRECERGFDRFLDRELHNNATGCEYYLPSLISYLIERDSLRVRVIESDETWYGMTYKEDKGSISAALKMLTERGEYPYGF